MRPGGGARAPPLLAGSPSSVGRRSAEAARRCVYSRPHACARCAAASAPTGSCDARPDCISVPPWSWTRAPLCACMSGLLHFGDQHDNDQALISACSWVRGIELERHHAIWLPSTTWGPRHQIASHAARRRRCHQGLSAGVPAQQRPGRRWPRQQPASGAPPQTRPCRRTRSPGARNSAPAQDAGNLHETPETCKRSATSDACRMQPPFPLRMQEGLTHGASQQDEHKSKEAVCRMHASLRADPSRRDGAPSGSTFAAGGRACALQGLAPCCTWRARVAAQYAMACSWWPSSPCTCGDDHCMATMLRPGCWRHIRVQAVSPAAGQ